MKNIKPGIYQHYKGGKYELLFSSEQTETKESLLVYRSLADNKIWVRPEAMWAEEIEIDGKKRPRFIWLEESHPQYPEPVVGPLIYNDQGEIFLIQNPKSGDFWTIPGGHIEWGEKMEETLIREVKEETNLDIDQIEFISAAEGIKLKSFLKDKHFIFLNFLAHWSGGEPKLSVEMTEYVWVNPNKAKEEMKLAPSIIDMIDKFIDRSDIARPDIENFEAKYTRALADYQNLLKQSAKDKEEFVKFAVGNFLQDILPVYDHLRMALSGLPDQEKDSAWVKGVEYVVKQFKDVLSTRGVEEIKTIEADFDHNLMEALEGEGTKVIKEVMPGYTLHGRVIRAAKVIVGK